MNEKRKTTLDVGCGSKPKGDVNGDYYTGDTPHTLYAINPKKTPNFFRLDAQNLPFRDNSFDQVMSFHCLEHLENPQKALRDMKRIAKEDVIIAVPVFHLCSLLVEAMALVKCFVAIPYLKTTVHFKNQINAVRTYKKRYSHHLWYIRSKTKRKVKRKFLLPIEYEYRFKAEQ